MANDLVEKLRGWTERGFLNTVAAAEHTDELAEDLTAAADRIEAGVCAECHSDVWNPGEGWLVRKDGMVTVCRSAWHPEAERNLPPVERLPRFAEKQ